jgi:hypothetical protein
MSGRHYFITKGQIAPQRWLIWFGHGRFDGKLICSHRYRLGARVCCWFRNRGLA